MPLALADTLPGAVDLDAALALVVAELRAESGTIHLLGSDGNLHLRAATAGIPQAVRDIVKIVPVGKGMAGLSVQRNAAVDACNIQTDTSGDVRPGAKATGMEGAIVVPIRRDGRPVGALGVANRSERTFTAAEISTLESAGDVLARRFA